MIPVSVIILKLWYFLNIINIYITILNSFQTKKKKRYRKKSFKLNELKMPYTYNLKPIFHKAFVQKKIEFVGPQINEKETHLNQLDQLICDFYDSTDLPQKLETWRIRFALIPGTPFGSTQSKSNVGNIDYSKVSVEDKDAELEKEITTSFAKFLTLISPKKSPDSKNPAQEMQVTIVSFEKKK